MCIRWGNTFSSLFSVSNGVKQGGILSPALFNIYMDGLSTSLNSSNIGGHIGGNLLNYLCYADDMCLISLSSAGMQRLLNICNDYADQHSLLYNGNKSFSMCFKSKAIKFKIPVLLLGELEIPLVSQCRYLGNTISEINCDHDINRQIRKFYSNVNILLRRFSKCSIDVKCYLFKMYCSNLYCSSFWFDSSKTAMKKIKIAYNNSLRRLLSLPKHNSASEMFVNLNILSFGELLRKFVYSFQSRVIMSDNILLSGISYSTAPLYSPIWAWWHTILII